MERFEASDCLSQSAPILPARLRTRSGSVADIDVTDLSLAGCLIERRALALYPEDRVLIRLGDLSFMPASVAWIEDQEAGLVFETELYEPVLEHLQRSFVRRR